MEVITEKKPTVENEIIDTIIERKLRLVENPSSLVIAPRTREGHLMTKMLFGFDRAVNQIRMKAATYIPIQDVTASLKNVENFMSCFEATLKSLGYDNYSGYVDNPYRGRENPETKRMLAERRTTYVFLPKTDEGKQIAMVLKRFDPLLLQFRATCTDFTEAEKVFDAVVDTVSVFHNLTVELSSLAKVNYKAPKGLSAITGGMEQRS